VKSRLIFSILLNLIAIAVPTAVVYRAYGPTASVNPESTRDLAYLLGTALFSFSLGLFSAALLRRPDTPPILRVLEQILFSGRSTPPAGS
jgi:hypothetical protein